MAPVKIALPPGVLEVYRLHPLTEWFIIFGCNVTVEVMHHLWLSSRHPINELEMIPVLVSFRLWGQLSRGCQVVHCIDNESGRLALLRGSGETSVAKHVAARIMDSECYLGKKSWCARVSSASNLAEDPSVETLIL